ncbi:MAG: hypothetical protein QM778_10635 [Myxococcales bacterium]
METTRYGHARSRGGVGPWAAAFAFLLAPGCVPHDEACGPHQVYRTGGELLDYEVCVCDEARGYVFDELKGHGCKLCPAGQSPENGKCASPKPDGGVAQDASMAHEPTGVGEHCESAADCASFDAKYCTPIVNTCAVDNCASGENSCGSTYVCCDFSALLSGLSLCISPDQLVDDKCPMGGMKVEP